MSQPNETAARREPEAGPEDRAEARAVEKIRHALRGLRYGSVTVTVQDGVVVQVDRTEKMRMTR